MNQLFIQGAQIQWEKIAEYTLLEAIAVAYGFNPEGGSKNYNFSTYDSHSELHSALRLTKGYRKPAWSYFLRAESFYNVATKEEEYSDLDHPSQKYHGEISWGKLSGIGPRQF